MNAKSSTRLRLECLETRSVLSAGGLPFIPPAAVPLPVAAAGDFYRLSEHQVEQAALQDAVQNAVAISNANLSLAPDRTSSRFDKLTDTAEEVIANPTLMPDRLSFELSDPSVRQPSTIGGAREPMFIGDLYVTSSPSYGNSLALGSTLNAGNGAVASVGGNPASSLLASNMNSANVSVDETFIIDTVVAGPSVTGSGIARHDTPPPVGVVVEQSVSVLFMFHTPAQLRYQGDYVSYVPADVDLAPSSPSTSVIQAAFDTSSVSRGPTVYRGPIVHPADQPVPLVVESTAPPSVDYSTPLVKGRTPDPLTASDTSRYGEPAVVAADATLPASRGGASLPATPAALAETTNTSSVEGGFITLDSTSATTSRLGSTPSNTAGFKASEGGDADRSSFLTEILQDSHKPAESDRHSDNGARSNEKLAGQSSLRGTPALPPAADAEEGGSIELAIVPPLPSAASDNLPPAGESAVGNAAQRLAEVRPDSEVGLFCDIEVAVAPSLPTGDITSATSSDQDASLLAAAPGIHAWKANALAGLVPPSARRWQPILAGAADHLPLLLGITVFVSRGGLRLEEKVPERERRLRPIESLRSSAGR
jgi:hypothetical protein